MKTSRSKRNLAPVIQPLEMTDADREFAQRIAAALGYRLTVYSSSSDLWGLFCLPEHAGQRKGCVILTRQFGFLFVADLEDMQMHELFEEERKLE